MFFVVPLRPSCVPFLTAAGFVNFLIAAGYNRGTYIFFVTFLEEFRAPVTETALLFAVKEGINSVVGMASALLLLWTIVPAVSIPPPA